MRKCPYCDFNSHQAANIPEADYVAALLDDLAREADKVKGRPLVSIFFGGGTPSLFSADAIGRVIEAAEKHLGFAPDIEITLEANPGTAEQHRFASYRTAGVNRLSLGVQSFNPRQLQHLGRIHSGEEATSAVAMARRAGFDNFNLDLMHGLPDQSAADACDDLRRAIALGPTHLSWYQLTIEPNTEFFRRPPLLPVEDALADIQDQGTELLQAAGFRAYEISAWRQPGRAARHNLNYWTFGDYLGIGAGAHGKVSQQEPNGLVIERHWKTRLPAHYLSRHLQQSPFDAGRERLATADLPMEFMMNALRLAEGTEETLFTARTGLPLSNLAPALAKARADGLMVPGRLQATPLGTRFLNRLLPYFE